MPRLVVIVSMWSHVATGLGCALRAHPLPIALACIQWTSVTTAWMMRSFSSSRTPEMSAVALDPLFRLTAKALSLLSTASTRSSSGVPASSACRSALVYVSTDPGSMTRMAVAPVLDPESVCVSLRTCCNASHASRTVGAPVGTSGPPLPLHWPSPAGQGSLDQCIWPHCMHGVGGGLLVSYATPFADTQSLVSPICWKPPVDPFLPQSAAQCPSSPHRKHLPGLAGRPSPVAPVCCLGVCGVCALCCWTVALPFCFARISWCSTFHTANTNLSSRQFSAFKGLVCSSATADASVVIH